MQILDRKKLLPPAYGGTWVPATPNSVDAPTDAELLDPQAGILYMSPGSRRPHLDAGVRGEAAELQSSTEFQTRDIVLLAQKRRPICVTKSPHWSFIVDVTVENSKTSPPGTRVEPNVFQGPMVLSTLSVDPL